MALFSIILVCGGMRGVELRIVVNAIAPGTDTKYR
jgi:hypothetical protein